MTVCDGCRRPLNAGNPDRFTYVEYEVSSKDIGEASWFPGTGFTVLHDGCVVDYLRDHPRVCLRIMS